MQLVEAGLVPASLEARRQENVNDVESQLRSQDARAERDLLAALAVGALGAIGSYAAAAAQPTSVETGSEEREDQPAVVETETNHVED